MAYKFKYAANLAAFCPCGDRLLTSGYKKEISIEEMFAQLATIPDCKAVEAVENWEINENNLETFKKHLNNYNFYDLSIN